MKKIILIALAITLINFIPVIQQEITGCETFGQASEHLISPAVTPPGQMCITTILAVPLIPAIQIFRLFHFDSVYANYVLLGVVSVLIYSLIGYGFVKIKSVLGRS
ncbi:MAG: hypothetical protein WCT46_00945 [Candidatus Gracilibacteria bacterium]